MARTKCPSAFRPGRTAAAALLQVLGARGFRSLQAAFGGRRVWIPKAGANAKCLVCESRDRCIRDWRRRGVPAVDIARDLGLSAKTVYRVLRQGAAGARVRGDRVLICGTNEHGRGRDGRISSGKPAARALRPAGRWR